MKRVKWENVIFIIYMLYSVYCIYYHIAVCNANQLMLEILTYILMGLTVRLSVKYVRLHKKEIKKDLKEIFYD